MERLMIGGLLFGIFFGYSILKALEEIRQELRDIRTYVERLV
jgi:hypothetical protein